MNVVNGKVAIDNIAKYNTIVSSKLPFDLVSLSFTAGYNIGSINIYGIKDGVETLVQTVEIDSIEYKQYDVPMIYGVQTFDQFKFKVVATSGEIRLSSLSIVSLTNGMTYSMNEFTTDDVKDNKLYFEDEIVNDQRHDGKTFMIAVQLLDNSGNVVEIPKDLTINVNGMTKEAWVDHNYSGRVTAFFNMTDIINELGVSSFDYTIDGAGSYTCVVQLLEVTNPQKPAMSEVRK